MCVGSEEKSKGVSANEFFRQWLESVSTGIEGLATLNAASGEEIGLIQLRKLIHDAGPTDNEREATFSIQRNITRDQLSSDSRTTHITGYLRTVGFEWTNGLRSASRTGFTLDSGARCCSHTGVHVRNAVPDGGELRYAGFPSGLTRWNHG
jgi:hypothetical protein